MSRQPPAVLVLEDGRAFAGEAYGARGETVGEAVFATGMSGYQETITDPSYARQIVVMTAPQIGNTGVNDEDAESGGIQVAGLAVREPARRASSWRARGELEAYLVAAEVVGIAGLDTRALTRHLRERGVMRAAISSRGTAVAELVRRVRAAPGMAGADLAGGVSTREPYVVPAAGARRYRVAVLDLGLKRSTVAHLVGVGCQVHVLPAGSTADDVLGVDPDGVLVSNGPGDPASADAAVATVRGVLASRRPLFGICFGHQVLARALGLSTYKLRYGHRGINAPVLDRATGRVQVTSHNHGFAVAAPPEGTFDTPYGAARVSAVALNDGVVEGLRCLDVPALSVQYHPEAAPGPHDAAGVFDRFTALMAGAAAGTG